LGLIKERTDDDEAGIWRKSEPRRIRMEKEAKNSKLVRKKEQKQTKKRVRIVSKGTSESWFVNQIRDGFCSIFAFCRDPFDGI
jgi:hypothetical protein